MNAILALFFAGFVGIPIGGTADTTSPWESRLGPALRNVKFGSPRFYQTLRRFTPEVKLVWQPAYGTTPLLIAKMQGPDAASVAFWPDLRAGTHVQVLEGSDSPLYFGPHYRKGRDLIRCGKVERGGNSSWPFVRIYRLEGERWKLVASKEVENFECAQLPAFAMTGRKLDPQKVSVVTRRYPTYLSQPHVGPLLNAQQTWVIRDGRIITGSVRYLQTALLELDYLAEMAHQGNQREFELRVPKRLRDRLWLALAERDLSVTCKTNLQDDQSSRLVLRTSSGDLLLTFRKVPGGYRLADLTWSPSTGAVVRTLRRS